VIVLFLEHDNAFLAESVAVEYGKDD